ncbi:MAG: hypothetical protein GKS03_09590 [Alphaproteobacteria bacterium]|nr:hypothetical protein [Alphaproteobacteria bacterium]
MRPYAFGSRSREKLDTCCEEMVEIAELAIRRTPVDFTIVHGFRGEDTQNALFDSGASRKMWPESKHNYVTVGPDGKCLPASLAIDFGPWVNGGIPWEETHMFALIAGVFAACAIERGYRVRWGGDFDGDGLSSDQTLLDFGHVEYAGISE